MLVNVAESQVLNTAAAAFVQLGRSEHQRATEDEGQIPAIECGHHARESNEKEEYKSPCVLNLSPRPLGTQREGQGRGHGRGDVGLGDGHSSCLAGWSCTLYPEARALIDHATAVPYSYFAVLS